MTLSPALTDDELDEEEEVMNLNDENDGSKGEDDVDEEEEEDEELELQRDMLALQQKRVEEKGGGKRDSINDEVPQPCCSPHGAIGPASRAHEAA